MQQIINQQSKWVKIFLRITTLLFIAGFLVYFIIALVDINSNAEFAGFGAANLFYIFFIPVLALGIIQIIFFLFYRKQLSKTDGILASIIPILFFICLASFAVYVMIYIFSILVAVLFGIFLTILFLIFLKNVYFYKVKK